MSTGLLGWRLEERSGSTGSPSLEVGGNISLALSDFLPQTSLRSPTRESLRLGEAVGPTGPEANLQHLLCLLPAASSSLQNPQSETGNPPEGWESEGQIRNVFHALCPMLYAFLLRTTDDRPRTLVGDT